jgi:hypothetical protein
MQSKKQGAHMAKHLVFVLLVIWTALTLSAQPAEIIITDTSQSQARWALQSRAEQRSLIARFPNDTQLVLLGVGSSVHRLFDGRLDPPHRESASSLVNSIAMADQNTALGEGIAEALRLSAAMTGTSKNIWIFTDGQNSPPPKSRFRGKHLNRILDEVVVPPDTQIYIRIFGAEQIISSKPFVHILKSPPDWNALTAPRPSVAKTAMPASSEEKRPAGPASREILPMLGIVATLAAAVVLGVFVLSVIRRKRANDVLADLPSISSPAPDLPDEPQPHRIFSIFIEGRAEPVVLGGNHCKEVAIGGSATADIYLPACDQQTACFTVEEKLRTPAISIKNSGVGEIEIGRRRLAAGRSIRLPDSPVEMRIGSQIVHVMGETVVTGGNSHEIRS